jgi:hypothetical protein
MVHTALNNCQLFCGSNESLAKTQFPLHPGAGLLFPSQGARTLAEILPHEKPKQLVIVDGTWSQARTMLRDLGQLKDLPHYKLAPSQPGQYRIRLEPTETSLSTVEAAAQALKEIEPETLGLDELLVAFTQMVQRQLDHPSVGREHYSERPKSGNTFNIPSRLLGNADSIVVAYGETGYRAVSQTKAEKIDQSKTSPSQLDVPRSPLSWVAKRLGSSESGVSKVFARTLTPDVPLTDSFLTHLELSREHFNDAVSPRRFREEWRNFLRDGVTVVTYSQGTLRLLENIGADFERCLALKSINFDQCPSRRSLFHFVQQENLPCEAPDPGLGRAGKRLANAVALVEYLRRIAADI